MDSDGCDLENPGSGLVGAPDIDEEVCLVFDVGGGSLRKSDDEIGQNDFDSFDRSFDGSFGGRAVSHRGLAGLAFKIERLREIRPIGGRKRGNAAGEVC